MPVGDTLSQIQNIAHIPQSIQSSLDAMKELTRNIELFGMDAGILIGYLLYIVLFFFAIKGFFLMYQKYKENEQILSKLFFLGTTNKKNNVKN
jgi:hypothetical protein